MYSTYQHFTANLFFWRIAVKLCGGGFPLATAPARHECVILSGKQ